MRVAASLIFGLSCFVHLSGAAEDGASFWLAPKADLATIQLAPADVKLLAAPESAVGFALIKTSEMEPSENYVPTRKDLIPLIGDKEATYRVEPGGLKVGNRPFGDRKYRLKHVPDALSGLTLLQTRMGHKSVVDGRYSVIVSVTGPTYVFVALDQRAIGTYKKYGAPSWLHEYAPTDSKIATDEPVMASSDSAFLVLVKKVPAGRVAFGPPAMDEDGNAMYFAFFGTPK